MLGMRFLSICVQFVLFVVFGAGFLFEFGFSFCLSSFFKCCSFLECSFGGAVYMWSVVNRVMRMIGSV